MTKSNTHAILADLHKLLSSYSTADFLDASNYGNLPQPMREALRALSLEAASTENNGSKQQSDSSTDFSSAGPQKTQDVPSKLVDLIHRSPHFSNHTSMVDYARSIGLKLEPRPKESRQKLARRLAALINELPKVERNKVIKGLSRKNNQTQGWIDVIKSRNQ